jgi:hypothetical protein
MKKNLILNLVEDMDKILYTFENDGKFVMLSSIRNELFQEANASLKQVKEALAQPAQEPVAWMYQCSAYDSAPVLLSSKQDWAESGTGLWTETPLYTTPPKRPWVGLTDEEASWCQAPSTIQTWKRIEAKLKEKNT